MAVYYKPQSPIQSGEDFIYPITTADQVKVDKDARLNAVGVYLKNIDNSTDTTVYGNNATTLDGIAAEDYALKTDTAPDSSKLGGKAPEYYLQPRNLLDNSDFRNPVNQRGATTAENSFIVDRWYTFNDSQGGGAALTSSGITLSGNGYLQQRLSKGILQTDKPYTFAVYYSDSTVDVGTNGVIIFGDGDFDLVNNVYANGKTISHVALYEGSYTADTLPPYVPKGYAAELAECLRYFERLGSTFSERIGNTVYVVSGAKSFVCSLQCSRKRIPHPSVSISDLGNYRLLLKDATNASTYSAASISSFDDITTQEPFISFRVNTVDAITQNSWIQLQRSDGATAAYIDVSADL